MPYRLAVLLTIIVIVPLGYFARFTAALPGWITDIAGSLAYQIFWMALVQFCFPKLSIAKTAIAVFCFSCAIEFLQLWQPPFLQAIRATLPGRLVLGNTFVWSDFPPYAIGCFLGWLLLSGVRQLRSEPARSRV
ncbi:ribosomal maturation YjgA family protein [Leptolyngbya sp. GGD]|uniref:ribosomal maturation YjgA family protein n=1 Tax=Leptolyngbya sp. GGD TaxID=2997907 RepID=UPI00227A3AA9|nr:DUF2809 domain-containing protein [Leptolyngbya sp. GGD]MCY6489559.1 DUF2809 domain-containing protein [Leptolyngbya sp. GGD]